MTQTIQVLGYEYKLIEDGDADTMGAYGRYHAKSSTMQLASDLSQVQRESTVLHEIIEAINYHLQLELSHATIMALESTLYGSLKANGVNLTPLAPAKEP